MIEEAVIAKQHLEGKDEAALTSLTERQRPARARTSRHSVLASVSIASLFPFPPPPTMFSRACLRWQHARHIAEGIFDLTAFRFRRRPTIAWATAVSQHLS